MAAVGAMPGVPVVSTGGRIVKGVVITFTIIDRSPPATKVNKTLARCSSHSRQHPSLLHGPSLLPFLEYAITHRFPMEPHFYRLSVNRKHAAIRQANNDASEVATNTSHLRFVSIAYTLFFCFRPLSLGSSFAGPAIVMSEGVG